MRVSSPPEVSKGEVAFVDTLRRERSGEE